VDLRLEHKFGPSNGHFRVVKEYPTNLSYEMLINLVMKLNDRLGVERKGKVIFPKIGQRYFTIRRKQ
jgi:hypothetical protein